MIVLTDWVGSPIDDLNVTLHAPGVASNIATLATGGGLKFYRGEGGSEGEMTNIRVWW